MHLCELLSRPDEKGKPRVYLLQFPYKSTQLPNVDVPTTIASLDGTSLDSSHELLAPVVGGKEALVTFLKKGGSVAVSEDDALRLGLTFIAIGPLRSEERMAGMVQGIKDMSPDEAAYWLKKIVNDNSPKRLASIAFRTLLVGE